MSTVLHSDFARYDERPRVNAEDRSLAGLLIVADESADWRVAGLRQVDRLLLALNDAVAINNNPVPTCIQMQTESARPNVDPSRLPHLEIFLDVTKFLTAVSQAPGAVILVGTRLVIARKDAGSILQRWLSGGDQPVCFISTVELRDAIVPNSMAVLVQRLRDAEIKAVGAPRDNDLAPWDYLLESGAISFCEKRLLRRSGKSQDGLIARLINRPVSRLASRALLHTSISPSSFTVMLMALPLLGAFLLGRGDYFGFVLGAILFQLHSTLDGCDGEIARMKYLDSPTGAKLDEVCDRLSTLMYALGLGFGLARQVDISSTMRWFYPAEAIFAVIVIGIGESLLTAAPIAAEDGGVFSDYAARHPGKFNTGDQLKLWVMQNSRIGFLGDSITAFFSHATKRDVFNLAFLLLILGGKPSWVLHVIALVAVTIIVLTIVQVSRRRTA